MENNFLEFINNDINNKKELINALPIKTKTNIKKFNATIKDMQEKYHEYRSSTRNYLLAKAKSFEINEVKAPNNLDEKLENLEYVKFLLNPINTYLEKMGFDTLLYQMCNYSTINFKSLNDIINSFLDKFQLAEINLSADDFNYTCFVNDYMKVFLEERIKKTNDYERLSRTFEEIYWINPAIIEHIELNFRKLIKIHAKKFESYISKLKEAAMEKNNIKNYEDCLEKIRELSNEIRVANEETITDIIKKAKNREIDINQYLENSKIRKQAFENLVPSDAKLEDVCESLEKLLQNLEELDNYSFFTPVFLKFKDEFQGMLGDKEDSKLESIVDEIEKKENDLERINKKIFNKYLDKFNFFGDTKKLKIKSNLKAKEIYELYKEYDQAKFKNRVKKIISSTMTVSDVLHLYYSYDYFKKKIIEEAFELTDYNEIIKYSEKFDTFAMNALNVISSGLTIFQEEDITQIIVNRYRLEKINVTIEDLSPDNLEQIKNKIKIILRVNKVNNSNTSIDKIWFMAQVENIINRESKNDEI